ncbi:MAG: response regulator [Hyphomicrobiales bacterium]|nr:MAG: response regulator [Hyphomicrobiales bacterium]
MLKDGPAAQAPPGDGSVAPARRMAVWSLGLIAAIVILLQAYLVYESYRSNLAEHEQLTATLANVVTEQTQRSLQSVLLVLEATDSEMGFAKLNINHQSSRLRLRSVPEVRGIYLVGADGRVRDSTLSGADLGFDVSQHDYVRQLSAQGHANVAIGAPILRRSLSAPEAPAHAFVPFALRLANDNGLLVAAVNVSFFDLQFRPLLDSNAAGVVITRFDGTVLADATRSWAPGTIVKTGNPIFEDYLPGIESRTFAGPPILGKSAQVVSFRVTRDFPVVVSVAIDRKSIWGAWIAATLPTFFATPVAIGLVLVALAQLAYQLRVVARQEHSLRISRDAAEAANRAKSQFLAVMSHEIRTPMNAVLGLAGSLMEERLTADQHASVKAIHEAGDALLVILNDILDYTRFEWGRFELESAAFDPKALVEQCVAIIGGRAAAKNVALEMMADEEMPLVMGDQGRLKQVILNVLSNAIKFTVAGKVCISLHHSRPENGEVHLEWTVRDTGIGIPEDRIGSLFGEFVQVDASINRRFGGSGLGLAICKRILNRMGGTIGVSSKLGRGTTVSFSVTLPEANAGAAQQKAEDSSEALAAQIRRLGRPLRLLVVDDNATNHVVAANMLRGFAVEVSRANDGTEAVALAAETAFDVILMDMRMPQMDGIAATRAIRSGDGPNAGTRIIAFTANAFPEDAAQCREAGMEDLVAKPVRKPLLLAALVRALEGRREAGLSKPAELKAAAAPPLAEADFDVSVYAMLAQEIGPEAMAESMEIFVSEMDARLQRMLTLDPEADREAVTREAHTVKGDARSFGFIRLSGLAAALEKEAKAGAPVAYGTSVEGLIQAWEAGKPLVPADPAQVAA